MPHARQPAGLLHTIERRLPGCYLAVAAMVTFLLCFVTAPFFGPDEANQSLRAIALGHGELIATIGPLEAGAAVDTGVIAATERVDSLRMAWERRNPDFLDRGWGPMTLDQRAALTRVRFTHRTQFTGFGNTATYPPPLYLPAIAGWRIGPAAGLGVLDTLLLARSLCALTALLLGWLALRLAAGGARWLLLAGLLLPSTLFLNATCSQDALLPGSIALVITLLTRPLAQRRTFGPGELLSATLLLAACAAARPPYAPLALLFFVPLVELPERRPGDWAKAAGAFAVVLTAAGLWRFLVRNIDIDTADEANPDLQTAFLQAHPLAAIGAVVEGTRTAALDFVHRGLYVIGWNDLLPHHGAPVVLAVCLVLVTAFAPLRFKLGLPGRLLLGAAVLASLLAVSLAEYLIWTPPGLATVYGILPRYWLPLLPCTLLAISGRRTVHRLRRVQTAGLLTAGSALLLVAGTLPFMAAGAFYRQPLTKVVSSVVSATFGASSKD